MAQVNGVVEATSNKFGKLGIAVGGKWYNTDPSWLKGPAPVKGDTVSFDDGGRNYIKNLTILGGSGAAEPTGAPTGTIRSTTNPTPQGKTFPMALNAPERSINRQSALRDAISYATALWPREDDGSVNCTPDDIITLARVFESYTTGQLDLTEASLAAQELGV